jgi:hypothetical protein
MNYKTFTLYADHDPASWRGDLHVRPGYDALDVLRYAEHHGVTLSAHELAEILSGNYVTRISAARLSSDDSTLVTSYVQFSTEVEV